MSKMIDLTGKTFGKLNVLERAENTKGGQAKWICECECGEKIKATGRELRSGIRTDCGHHSVAWNFVDLTGKRFGRLTVIKRAENYRGCQAQWKCKCDCGNETVVRAMYLKNGSTKSCGCYKADRIKAASLKHGMSGTRLWRIWNNMHSRCEQENSSQYSYYGERGVEVCEEWSEFKPFMEWALSSGYKENLTIDRIDFDGNYCPENCRWVTRQEQNRNKSSNHFITIDGETKILEDWARESGLDSRLIGRRLKDGWDVKRAVFQPVRGGESVCQPSS